jgi:hypothetical protein
MKKQETLEEVAERLASTTDEFNMFIAGAKWQQERMYSEEEVIELLNNFRIYSYNHGCGSSEFLEWFEQFKKKQDERKNSSRMVRR